jgi:hypothetical protein
MLIIGCDFHTRYQQIAMAREETGELLVEGQSYVWVFPSVSVACGPRTAAWPRRGFRF